jgi:hypothetical protein
MHKETEEQTLIKRCPIDSNEIISIQAYAGAGKTYILKQLARRLQREFPTWKILYLAFNRDIVTSARQEFPRNVNVMTTHSLANRAVGRKYFDANKISTNIRKTTIRKVCSDWCTEVMSGAIKYEEDVHKLWCRTNTVIEWNLSNTVWSTLNTFLYSGDPEIDVEHVPAIDYSGIQCVVKKSTLVCMAQHMWARMQDLEDSFKMTHDGYLKLYQLSGPELHKDYQVILFDEAQDANGATLSIVEQAKCCKIYVGDPHQQIYSWRGSINAFSKIEETKTQDYRLSQSFRFNTSIAQYATRVLYAWKEEEVPVQGQEGAGGVGILTPEQEKGVLNIKHTYLCRLNSSIFRKAVSCLDKYPFGFAGQKEKYKDLFQDILDVYFLSKGRITEIKSIFIKNFRSFESIQVYAAQSHDYEISGLCSVVKTYGDHLPTLLDRIWEQALPEERAHIILTTGHRSKGREWPYVVLCSDFMEKFREKGGTPGTALAPCRYSYEKTEEANLLYVAITRAQHSVYLPELLKDMILTHYEYSVKNRESP